uniref:Transposase n=1 Tax=Caenorhabditis tropicalis TaxID=1561998 RepID=A0A1I7UXZ7_9PELO
MPAKSTLHKDPAVQSKSISVEQKRKEDNEDIKFIEKGTIFITSHNINEFAVSLELVTVNTVHCPYYT